MDSNDYSHWDSIHKKGSTFSSFWANVKSCMTTGAIRKCFITGVLPVSLSHLTSSLNISRNISFKKEFFGLCGLTHSDIYATLKLLCRLDPSCTPQRHLERMRTYLNSYHFCRYDNVPRVFQTNNCLEYFQVSNQR
jgi:hypothetical protein